MAGQNNETRQRAGGDAGVATETTDSAAVAARAAAAEKFYVDGRAVSEADWLKAAGENGYDLSRLPPNYRPAINTKEGSK